MVRIISGDLETEGYLHLRDCIDPKLVTPELIKHIESTGRNPSDPGAILRPQHTAVTREIEKQTINAVLDASPGLDRATRPRTTDPVQLAPGQPLLAIRVGPPPSPGEGGLGWHVDAFSYYLRAEHKDWYVCYTPILKEKATQSNLAVIPYSVLRRHQPELYTYCKGRGAINLGRVGEQDLDWAHVAFGADAKVGDWYANDISDDASYGMRLTFNLEDHRVVPALENFDVLVFRADLIHRTEDTNCNRISIKTDLVPKEAPSSAFYIWWWYFSNWKTARMVIGMRQKYFPWRMAVFRLLSRLRFAFREVKSIDEARATAMRGG